MRGAAKPFDFSERNSKELNKLIMEMKETMRQANGVGLAGNQIGLNESVFVAEVPGADGRTKFYTVFNPKIEKVSKETETVEEGCLSVPGMFGDVERAEKITVSFLDKNAKPQKLKAWGLLARVFQHEIDHLHGKLIVDRAKKMKKESDA